MYRLLEIVYTDKESVAIYPTQGQEPYASKDDLISAYEIKLGQAMKAPTYKAALLIAFDSVGNIYAEEYHTKDDSVALSPRLLWVQTDKQGVETADQSKENSMEELEADRHIKKGSAMATNSDIDSIMLFDIDGKKVSRNEYWYRYTYESEQQS